jgi:two-component system, OmpR family, sensor histidine kinase TorS
MLHKSSLSRASLGRMLLMTFVVTAGLPAITGFLGWFELQKVARNQAKVVNESIPAISQVRGFAEESSRIVAVAPELAAVTDKAARRERADYLFAQVDALRRRVARYEDADNPATESLARAEANVRGSIEQLDRLVHTRITATEAQAARLKAGLAATTELLEIADTLVANAEMGTAAAISNLYDLENTGPTTATRLDTLDKLIEVDLFRQGLMSEMRSHIGEVGLLLNRIPTVQSQAELVQLQAELEARILIVTRRILAVNDPIRAEQALSLLQMIRPSSAPPPEAEDILNLTKGILDLNRLIGKAQGEVRAAAAQLDNQAQALADLITTRAVEAGDEATQAISTTQQLYAWGPIAAFLISLAVVWFYVRGNIARRLAMLSETMARLAHGEQVGRIVTQGLDEIAEMEAAVEVFRLQGIEKRALSAERDQNLAELQRHRLELQLLVAEQTKQLRGEVSAHAEARKRAEAADRAKSEFLALMSHEIRTPMNGVLGIMRSLGREGLTPRQQLQLRAAHASGEGLMTILNDILDYSKIEAGAAKLIEVPFSPADLVRDIAVLMAPSAQEKGLALYVDLAADLPAALTGDMGKLRQILFNLVSNAVKFTQQGEVRLMVSVREAEQSPELTFVVKDTGKGIADAAQGRIFGVFEQEDAETARQYGGTGLGLAICKRFADVMGAKLAMESTAGAGSMFTLVVQFALADKAIVPVDAPYIAVQPATRKLRALVVEDNDINQLVIQTFLEDMGHMTRVVDSAEMALKALQEARFDVILMDVNLPGLSGIAATRAIRASRNPQVAGVPIIGISAHVQDKDILESITAGMSGMLAKPLSPQDLQAALLAHLPHNHVLMALAQDIGPVRAATLARLFVNSLPKTLASIDAAARFADFPRLSNAAHQLKGAVGNFDLAALSVLLGRIEKLAKLGASTELDTCLRDLPDVLDQARFDLDVAIGVLDASFNQAAL